MTKAVKIIIGFLVVVIILCSIRLYQLRQITPTQNTQELDRRVKAWLDSMQKAREDSVRKVRGPIRLIREEIVQDSLVSLTFAQGSDTFGYEGMSREEAEQTKRDYQQ